MSNKLIFKFLLIFLFYQNILSAEIFTIESAEIEILDKGNITKATNGVKIISNDGIEINGRDLIYNKEKSVLKIIGNVILNDKKNNIVTKGEEYIYFKNEEKIISIGKTKSHIKNTYYLEGDDLIYERKLSEIYSDKKTKIEDSQNNIFFAEKFKFNFITSILKAKNLSLFDNKKNQYYLDFALVNLKDNKFLGSDISIDFEDSLFGNNENDPRLKGNSLISEENNTTVYKGSFTTCNQEDKKCPPWSMYAEEIIHKKDEKKIEYKNAWLKIYDKPVLYFPYFFHPDPTVKRQSGFLMPSFKNSNNSGTSIQIPYYKVISERKDLTLFPRLFLDNEALLQTEYRQANKNSDLVLDLSVNKDDDNIKNHFFADLSSNKQDQTLNLHLETVSNDTYLKTKNITSPIINDNSSLNSYINYNSFNEYSSFEVSFEVYENLNETSSDRYEYIFPNFNYEKYLYNDSDINGDFTFNARGYQKNYDTNSDEAVLINDIKYSSFSSINSKINGMVTNYNLLLRNLNSTSENSDSLKDGEDHKILSTIIFESKLPLKKENQNSKSILSPKFSARYSPNATKNNSDLNKSINYEGIFALDRIDDTAVEGGVSFTSGIEYSLTNKEDQKIINLSFANIIRTDENPDLPKLYGFSEKRSDFIGEFGFSPSKFFDLNYQFSVDKDLSKTNYNLLKTNININNFVTSFEFLEEDNYLNENSYLINETKLNFDNNNSIGFGASKNLDQNITNYYNLIYEYENDCLTAAIEYNKSYYVDRDLKPDENILFSIKIIPFGKISSPSLTND
tara:strand:- start:435 stop:2810 length:2376 start_codon:yes stop_codon:yes gene_type:complete